MKNQEHLYILWTNADVKTAEFMVFMYATNAKLRGWWNEVTLVVWGATAELTAKDEHIQLLIKRAQDAGVKVEACQACAVAFGIKSQLEDLGIKVFSWGPELTRIIKEEENLITI